MSQAKAALRAYLTALRDNGGQGLLYWEPQGYAPFTPYNMVVWDGSTRQPTAIMDGFIGGDGGGTTYVRLRNRATDLYIDGMGAYR